MKVIRPLVIAGMLAVAAGVVSAGDGTIDVQGAFEATIEDASVNLAFNERAGIWMLQLRSPREYKEENGVGFNVNLFFSRRFEPATGTFPILFSYLAEKDGLGGSVIVSGEESVMFSHDTAGEAVFSSFGDVVEGSFAFEAFEGSGECRRTIRVRVTFSCARGKAFH